MKKILALLSLFAFHFSLFTLSAQTDSHNLSTTRNLDVFNVIYKNLDMAYVDTLNPDNTVGTAIKAMMRSLDPYTEYYPESEVKSLRQLITGKYAGVGAIIRENTEMGGVMIDYPYPDMPAAKAGLRKGDLILSIDDSTMLGKSTAYVSEHLRGDAGSEFKLKARRPSTGKELTFHITRRTIQMPCITYYGMLTPETGYLALDSYTEGCAREVRNAFLDLKAKGMKSFLLDLRDNGGGSVQEALQILNMFLPKDTTVLTMKGKVAGASKSYKTMEEPLDTVMPIIILTNENTASASEITSGALQDFHRARTLGTKTFGKGLVQVTMDLPYNGQMKFTTAKYYLPSGRCIQKIGINPDIEVKPDTLSNLVFYLTNARDSSEVAFHFVYDYIQNHPSIDTPDKFNLTDADLDQLKSMILKSRFKYDRQTSTYLKELEKVAKFEGYYDNAKSEFDALEAKLNHNLADDFEKNRESIRQAIGHTIVQNYYGNAGAMQYLLRFDSQIKEALKSLSPNPSPLREGNK